MSDIKAGGPAFPTTNPLDGWGDPSQGMTLRDYFAAKAMNIVPDKTCYNMKSKETDCEFIARKAYEIADAMLEARK